MVVEIACVITDLQTGGTDRKIWIIEFAADGASERESRFRVNRHAINKVQKLIVVGNRMSESA